MALHLLGFQQSLENDQPAGGGCNEESCPVARGSGQMRLV